ncbi:bifunctional heptose 7-phosphate kinase/heptose 1-phosphate adenyltransferase [Desulfonatronum thioautotrophicum]|uniref:bifunctional heptose 7-phosphate kinase/heptose 1-phosphate adenyltransferase n=1 Tax=Desulfonatronum thioautotrophicum TaxID=617001 RepID=UPI00069A6587|nr:PfkB family carbohydrate kinase [Desulfonatronum thioautotrophicum]
MRKELLLQPAGLLEDICKLSGTNVVILGDVMLDEYIFGTVERISPEAPVPIVRIESEEYRLGGAGNVAKNITALGGTAKLFGTLGRDVAAVRMREMFQVHCIEDHCFQESERLTTCKTRIIAQQQQIVRIDREPECRPSSAALEYLLREVAVAMETSNVLIVSDYGKGIVSTPVMDRLRAICDALPHSPRIIVDPKPKNFSAYSGVALLTPNTKEAGIEVTGCRVVAEKRSDLVHGDVLKAGQRLLRELHCKELLITLGALGMMLFQSATQAVHIPTAARKVYDVTGAGDTVIAVMGLAMASGLDTLRGCLLANYAAGIVVGQIGATAVTPEQLREVVLSWPTPQVFQHSNNCHCSY